MDQNVDSSGSDQIQTPQYPVIHQPSQEISEENFQAKGDLMKSIRTFWEKFNRYPFGEKPKILLQAWEKFFEIQHAQPEDTNELFQKLLKDLQIIREELLEYINSPKKSPDAIAPILLTEEPEYSLSMGYEHLNTTSKTKSDKIIKSGVEELVPIPREYEVTLEDKRECDVLVCKDSSTIDVCDDHSEILSNSNNDDISSDDDAFEDIKYVEASLLNPELVGLEENDVHQEDEKFNLEDIQDVILHEKLLSINRLIANIESLNDNPTPYCVFKSSASFPIFEESDNSSPIFETFSDHTGETRSGSTTTHANNSLPEYDSFCFKIEPDQEKLTRVVKNDRDIRFLKELLINYSITFPNNESSDFEDDPLFPRPPPEPPDVEFCFDLEPDLISDVIAEEISDNLNEDNCFDPRGDIDIFANVEDDNYFPFTFFIRIFLPYLSYPEVSPLLLSVESEDTIFDPDISV
uniref:Reverse transcriptase domain-containing protein n=1 Tax=Tanacetum cinerariifolium TaxID=118510 RepID=A0A6L2NEW5_TANCI|nr:hypothetical protein [Tanacetum cinerariifolium]